MLAGAGWCKAPTSSRRTQAHGQRVALHRSITCSGCEIEAPAAPEPGLWTWVVFGVAFSADAVLDSDSRGAGRPAVASLYRRDAYPAPPSAGGYGGANEL
jgi:hypothetical protein